MHLYRLYTHVWWHCCNHFSQTDSWDEDNLLRSMNRSRVPCSEPQIFLLDPFATTSFFDLLKWSSKIFTKKTPKKIAQMIDVPVGKSAKSPYISKPWVLDGPHQITHHPQRNTQKPGDHGSRSQWQEGTHGIVCSCFGTQFWKLLVYKNPFLLPMFIFDLSCMVRSEERV